jgi:hypothetical protein
MPCIVACSLRPLFHSRRLTLHRNPEKPVKVWPKANQCGTVCLFAKRPDLSSQVGGIDCLDFQLASPKLRVTYSARSRRTCHLAEPTRDLEPRRRETRHGSGRLPHSKPSRLRPSERVVLPHGASQPNRRSEARGGPVRVLRAASRGWTVEGSRASQLTAQDGGQVSVRMVP